MLTLSNIGLSALAIIILLLAAFICKKYLGYSHLNFIKEIVNEFRLIGTQPWSPGGINALAIISCVAILLVYFASSSLEKIIRISTRLAEQQQSAFPEIISAVLVLSLLSLVCVMLCKKAQ